MVKRNLIAFDPGLTTGYTWGTYSDTEPYVDHSVSSEEEGLTVEQFFGVIGILMTRPEPVTVVCEDFTLQRGRPMSSDQIAPVYLIGALQYLAYQNRNISLVMQKPSAAKAGVTDEHLEKLGLLRKPKTRMDHMNDALRHAVLYLKAQKHMPTLKGGFK